MSVCGEHFTDWFSEHTCCFLMTHHPPTWLAPSAMSLCAGEIAPPGRFVVHMCGHMHEPLNVTQSLGGAHKQRLWQAPSIFGLELTGSKLERRHGYVAGTLVVAGNTGTLRIWPRLAQRHQAGNWHFIREPSVSVEADEGTKAEELPVNQVSAAAGGKAQVFRVLLLSTDADLAPTRKAIADHLRRSLGIEVSTETSIIQHHLVILIQGMRWEDGHAAAIWQKVDPKCRVIFVSADEADWPPYRFVEINMHTTVSQFRASLTHAHKFTKPEQLVEMVSAIVTDRLQMHSGDQAAGLHSWERSYLEFRIPAWRAGRTAASHPHLFDAADAKELYQPDLYTGLYGTANSWECGKNGSPLKSVTPKARSTRIIHVERRVKLARWLTAPQLSSIALIGAPGGGKTIFLTRIAATLGSACLGRPVDFEPDLDVEALRRGNRLPIPIVVEATRLAQRDPSKIQTLFSVIADEIGSASTERPDPKSIELGLTEGRYFVLVDALDEIADSSKRSKTLALLKGTASLFTQSHLLVTTRSARYTGRLRFGPELESVEVAPLSSPQVEQLCRNWSRHRQRDDQYHNSLMGAVSGLADSVGQAEQDQALTENPLMLTAICMVFERYRSLPDDRGRLCDLLIDDLCQSRQSEDTERNWKLDEAGKRNLLQRIALNMQEQGAQTWPFEKAVDIALAVCGRSPKT